jgi:hypothetical protein
VDKVDMELFFHTGRDMIVLDLPLDDFESLLGLLLLAVASRELKLRKKLLIEATHSAAKLQSKPSTTHICFRYFSFQP